MFVNVSDVSAFIGQNKWDMITPFERLWKNNDPESYNKTILEMKQDNTLADNVKDSGLTKIEKMEKYLGKARVKEINLSNKTTDEKKQVAKSILDTLDIDTETKSKVSECIESVVNTTHGIVSEPQSVEIFNKKNDVILQRDNKLYKKEFSKGMWLCGRVDGIHDNYIVEIKNRIKGFFNRVRDYENTQIQLYMWLIPDKDFVVLEECFQGESKSIRVYKDVEYTEYVLELLTVFVTNFKKFLTDADKTCYFKKTDFEKSKFIRSLMIDQTHNPV